MNAKLKEEWESIFLHNGDCNQDLITEQLKRLDERGAFPDCLLTLIKLDEVKVLYVSSSVQRILGFSPEEYVNQNIFLNRGGSTKQKNIHRDVVRSFEDFRNITPGEDIKDMKDIMCGVLIKHKDGSYKKTLLKHTLSSCKGNIWPLLVVGVRYDITEYLKGEDYWIYREKKVAGQVISKLYRENNNEKQLITPREKEILMLIASGLSSREVASQLHISIETVGQHRKNMIQRTHAKDTSSLIHLCKLCEII